jgi:hypothetical protein
MKPDARISPDAMVIFLKQAALENHWTIGYLGKALGLNPSVITSKPASHDHLKTGQAQECRTTRF